MIKLPNALVVKITWLTVTYCLFCSQALAELPKIDKLKAAYMYNFTKFITWQSNESVPIVFCIHKNDELLSFFDALVKTREKDKVSLVVSDSKDATACHMTYLSASDELADSQLRNSVLITENNEIIGIAPVFRFYTENQKLRFEIDVARADELNIKISAKLLQVARIK